MRSKLFSNELQEITNPHAFDNFNRSPMSTAVPIRIGYLQPLIFYLLLPQVPLAFNLLPQLLIRCVPLCIWQETGVDVRIFANFSFLFLRRRKSEKIIIVFIRINCK